MHHFYYRSAAFVLALETCFFVVWVVFDYMLTLNRSLYEQYVFDSVFHFFGPFLIAMVTYNKLRYRKNISGAPVILLCGLMLVMIRNVLHIWSVVPNYGDLHWTFAAVISLVAVILTALEFLWMLGLYKSNKYSKEEMHRIRGKHCLTHFFDYFWYLPESASRGMQQTLLDNREMISEQNNNNNIPSTSTTSPVTYGLKAKPTYY